ncbi:Methyltransferase domain-containing protein [Nocardioides terrae]|uniref:Methyltransferase domain-containing protein n=1 Tax=Nocardioides terrae TaxID=574651 RepID=A0A1I1F183_9ACTN|nr:class I SAM-dependent methyltransferase [Nocardioides terrae]SFB92736.1 Methyltransferase domain-containing protein [Nocardioides terrae]
MSENSRRWAPYGVDAAPLPAVVGAAGVACAAAAVASPRHRVGLALAAAGLLGQTAVYLHTTLRGKLRIWERELDRLGLNGDERLLDIGCGRGAVLVAAARKLPAGRATGIDLWTADQSGNSRDATLANARAAGVADRVDVRTGDMTGLPFADGSFDVVTAAMAIHNVPSSAGRLRAVDEALRVLRPGGRLLVADPWPMARSYAAHLGRGAARPLGAGYWYGGPWLGVTMLEVVKGAGPDA